MSTLSLSSTTTRLPAVVRHAETLKTFLRQARDRARLPQSNYIRALAKSVLSSVRCKAIEIVVCFVVDIARRGRLEDAEAIGQHLTAIARAEWATAHPEERRVQLSYSEASLAEEMAQGEHENAEKALDLDPKNLSKKLALLAASAKYSEAKRRRDEALQREVAAQ